MDCLKNCQVQDEKIKKIVSSDVKFAQERISYKDLVTVVGNLQRRLKTPLQLTNNGNYYAVMFDNKSKELSQWGTTRQVYDYVWNMIRIIDRVNQGDIKLRK